MEVEVISMYINVLVESKVKSNEMTFTYHVPSNMEDSNLIGKRVLVPFGPRIIEGFVLSYTDKNDDYEMKDIIEIVDEESVLNDELLSFSILIISNCTFEVTSYLSILSFSFI